ncbi:MAG: excisionase family DNA-binding protein [Chloroflexota bacterium]
MSDRLAAALAELVDALRADVIAELAPIAKAPDRLLSVDEAANALGIGRTAVYGEIQADRLRSIKVGRRRLVPATAIATYIGGRAGDARRPAA